MQMYSDYEGLSLLSCIVWVGNIFIYTWNPNDLCTQLLCVFFQFPLVLRFQQFLPLEGQRKKSAVMDRQSSQSSER